MKTARLVFVRLSACLCAGAALSACRLATLPITLASSAFKSSPKKQREKPEAHGLASLGDGTPGRVFGGGAQQDGASGALAIGSSPQGGGSSSDGLYDFSSVAPTQGWRPQLNNWKRSATEAIREAKQQNKLLLIFATHEHVDSALQLESTLLVSKEFRNAVDTHFILLRIDYSLKETTESPLYMKLKRDVNVRGYPTLAATLPDGHSVLRLSGWQPEWKGRYVQSIKECIEHGNEQIQARRKRMEAIGYRQWTDKNGTAIFGRLKAVDANQLTFTGEWGDEFKTFLNRLSEQDQKAVAAKFPVPTS